MDSGFERVITGIALIIVLIGAIADFLEDMTENAPWLQQSLDVGSSLFVAGALIYIWIHRPRATAERNKVLETAVRRTRADLHDWKAKASSILRGLGAKIDEQFDQWKLTKAEKEVALLLVKGMSQKEIASLRGTSERTVRQQASQIYTKAGLQNRAELAAFFLEDLLLPSN